MLCIFVIGSSPMSRLVEGTAAVAEGEDHKHSEPLSPIISLLASDDAAEGGNQLRAQELALHVVVVAAFDERNVFGGVVLGATDIVLQIR